jgi:hypothetical protein
VRSLLALAAATLLTSESPPAEPADLAGTYRLQGEGRVDARPFPPRQAELHADAVLTAGAGPEVHVHLAGQGMTCDLTGTLDAGGALTLGPGQRCATDLAGDMVDGRVEAQLVSGTGRLRGEELELQVAFTVSGAVRLRRGGLLQGMGSRLALPGASDSLPVSGAGQARASGRRDRSRAASR